MCLNCCLIYLLPQVVLLYASTYVLVSLSIDRYHAIVYPMKFLQGGRRISVPCYCYGYYWIGFRFKILNLVVMNYSFLLQQHLDSITVFQMAKELRFQDLLSCS